MALSELIAQLQQVQAEHGDGTLKRADIAFLDARAGGRSQLITLRYDYHAEREARGQVQPCQPCPPCLGNGGAA